MKNAPRKIIHGCNKHRDSEKLTYEVSGITIEVAPSLVGKIAFSDFELDGIIMRCTMTVTSPTIRLSAMYNELNYMAFDKNGVKLLDGHWFGPKHIGFNEPFKAECEIPEDTALVKIVP